MKLILNRVLFNRCICFTFKDSRRFKGHSKWDNIKHVKAEQDNKRMLLFQRFKIQMKAAVQEYGSTKPENNLKLAQIIEHAKDVDMPISTIKNFLEKMESRKDKSHEGVTEIRGPNGYIMLAYYITHNIKQLQMDINNRLKKTSGSVADPSVRNMFTHVGSIIVEKKDTLEQATDDAIDIGAEDVEEFEENDKKYFEFKCDPKHFAKIRNLLERRQYCVSSVVEDYVPHTVIKLNESDLKAVSLIHERLKSLEDIVEIYDNIE